MATASGSKAGASGSFIEALLIVVGFGVQYLYNPLMSLFNATHVLVWADHGKFGRYHRLARL